MKTIFAFGARAVFLFEKRSKLYTRYSAVSIAGEKTTIAQKLLRALTACGTVGSGGA